MKKPKRRYHTNKGVEFGPIKKDVNITDCNFIGVQWDRSALEVIKVVADGLFNLSSLFHAQNVQIDALLKVSDKSDSLKDKSNEENEHRT